MIAGLDWINPVLLREYQQVVRSRSFAWIGMIWLLAQLVISLTFISLLEPKEAGLSLTGPGEQYFGCVIGGLAVIFLFVLPLSTFARVVRDRKEATLELLTISRVNSLQIVLGFLLIAFAQVGLFVLLSFPFVVFAYLFRGLELTTVLWSLYFLVLGALVANAVTLTIASFCRTPRITMVIRAMFGLGMLFFGLPLAWTMFVGLFLLRMGGRGHGGIGPLPDVPWLLAGVITLAGLLVVGLAIVIARSNLLFEAANRTTLPRLTITGIFLIAGGTLNAFSWFGTFRQVETVYVFDVASFLLLLLYGLWILGEPNKISTRMREGFPTNPILRRLAWPFLPGRGTAFVYLILNGLLLAVLTRWAYLGCGQNLSNPDFLRAGLLKPYSLLILGTAALVHHLAQRTKFSNVYFWAWLLIVGGIFMWAPLLWGARPFSDDAQFESFMLGSLSSDRTFFWRGFGAPFLGLLLALPSILDNVRNLRRPPAPPTAPPVIRP